MPKPPRSIALVDANNFYCSCEQLFRPDLKRDGKIVVVLSNNDGCVVARSAEAKAIGIKMGAPWFQMTDIARKNNVIGYSSNYELYSDMSNRVMSILRDLAPAQEIYSIDESFLDLSGCHDIRERSYAMREKVARWTGLTVCVGIGPSKTLAKLANHVAKKHPRSKGVFDFNQLTPRQLDSVLGNLEVGDIWGIGRKLSEKLNALGIENALQLREADPASMRARFGVVVEKTIRELRAEECISLEEITPARKQIVSSRSFGNPVTELVDLADSIAHFVSTAGGKLRSQKSTAGILTVFIMTDRFREDRPQYHPSFSVPLPQATADTTILANYAAQALKRIFKTGYAYKKAGIILADIGQDHIVQTDLFAEPEPESSSRLMEALDAINFKYGKGTLRLANDGASTAWAMRTENKSPAYTTRLDEVPRCR